MPLEKPSVDAYRTSGKTNFLSFENEALTVTTGPTHLAARSLQRRIARAVVRVPESSHLLTPCTPLSIPLDNLGSLEGLLLAAQTYA